MKYILLIFTLLFLTVSYCWAVDDIQSYGISNPNFISFDSTVINFMQQRGIPGGALAVVKDGHLVYARGYG